MNATDLINKELIEFDVQAETKAKALGEIARIAYEAGRVQDQQSYFRGLMEREKEFTTGFGDGIAIPHAKLDEVNEPTICIIKLSNPIDWDAMDDQPVQLVIAMAVPTQNEGKLHLKLLATLSEQLMEDDFKEALLSACTKDEIYQVVSKIF
ncbi:PTS sugar transporter subunit IIA [Paraliobacillus sp. JSM ZJ581]|uniref:PTS sugar transporter subunit IIA n=1 Tax=Paraliobacillus sp. JSM ZJ581 TaxID=3342118 RepID=UPI0035A95D31